MRYCPTCRGAFQALRSCPRCRVETRADIADPLIDSVLGERYRILERLAAGGMGQVYRAAHTRIASLSAVKVLFGDIAHDPEMRTRFQREAEAASCLSSRHIVRVIDFGETPEGLLYLAMEFLDGAALDTVVARDGAMAPARVIRFALQIARGLAHAHERGVVHRDLKPGNVMLVTEDDEPEIVRLLDFGIARLQSGSRGLTRAGALMGSPEYMAPEQFRGLDVDGRADLYALGVILYELLTGNPPFELTSLGAIASNHLHDKPTPLPDRARALQIEPPPPALCALVDRLLAKSPDDRHASARALIEALRALEQDASAAAAAVHASPAAPEPASSVPTPARTVPAAVADVLGRAIQAGAPIYNAGDHAACAATYRDAATRVIADATTSAAVAARLEVGLARASAADSATAAAWELRYAFDDLLVAAQLPATPAAAPGNATQTFGLAAELDAVVAILAPQYQAGHLDRVGDTYLAFARRIASRMRATGGQPSVIATLDGAVEAGARAGGGQRALVSVGRVIDALRRGHTPLAPSLPILSSRIAERCPALRRIADEIAQAVAVGAPAYNAGDPAGCLRVYRHCAESIVGRLAAAGNTGATASGCAEVGALLRAAIDDAVPLTADQGAWTLRYAFDALLAAAAGGESPHSRA